MANEEQLSILRQGVEVWNKWREENPNEKIDLSEADLSNQNLMGVDFGYYVSRPNLNGVRFSRSILYKANFTHANLVRANFSSANLIEAVLFGADLQLSDFVKAKLGKSILNSSHLDGAVFTKAEFVNTSFMEADMGGTIFTGVNLSECIGLDTIFHHSPSYISSDTLLISHGKVPLHFLRSCGLSDIQIESAKLNALGMDPALVTDITYKIHQLYLGGGVQYYSCFISYSNKDEDFSRKIHDDLQNNGVRCWFAPEDMKIGDQIRPRIDQEIRLRDKLLVILSENSVKSEWVGDEVEAALEEEKKNNRSVLFPIRLDDTVLNTRDDWAAKIKRRRHIGDFSNWKDKASYQNAFERLLRDLKATGESFNGK